MSGARSDIVDLDQVNLLFSFYAPAIISTGVLLFSIFSSTPYKGVLFVFFLFVATAVRFVLMPSASSGAATLMAERCFNGQKLFQSTGSTTYTSFIISFALMYFLIPQIIQTAKYGVSMVNYFVLFFFIMYFIYDILIKRSISCINLAWTAAGIGRLFADAFGGSVLAVITVCILYYSGASSVLFINELNSNKEVCSQPSAQKFKCSVYKNGELVSQTIKSQN